MKTPVLLITSVLAFASCSRDEAASQIMPAPEGSYSRSVVYLDQAKLTRHDTIHQSSLLQLSAKLSREGCTIYLLTPNQEEVGFNIPRSQMPATLYRPLSFSERRLIRAKQPTIAI